MKRLFKPVDMIAWFDSRGNIHPVRFRMDSEGSGETLVIPIDKIVKKDEEKLAGNRMLVFDCYSEIDHVQRNFQLKYELSTCRWYLYKM